MRSRRTSLVIVSLLLRPYCCYQLQTSIMRGWFLKRSQKEFFWCRGWKGSRQALPIEECICIILAVQGFLLYEREGRCVRCESLCIPRIGGSFLVRAFLFRGPWRRNDQEGISERATTGVFLPLVNTIARLHSWSGVEFVATESSQRVVIICPQSLPFLISLWVEVLEYSPLSIGTHFCSGISTGPGEGQ